jgi:hypothetical protein
MQSKERASPDPRLLLANAALDAFEGRLVLATKQVATVLAVVSATALSMGVYGLRHMEALSSNQAGLPSAAPR